MWFFMGCGFLASTGHPVVEAHRAGAGMFPENSRSAVQNALDAGWPAIEFDLQLSLDGQLVIHHDPWLDVAHCTHADGSVLTEKIWIHDLNLDSLQTEYLCGGVADPEFPDRHLQAESLLSYLELLELVSVDPALRLHHDLKTGEGEGGPAEATAEAVLQAWETAMLENEWYVTATQAEALSPFQGITDTSLIWPDFPPESNSTALGLGHEASTLLGLEDPIQKALEAHAKGLAMPYQLLDRNTVQSARAQGLQVQIWTLDSKALLTEYCDWPVQALITDYPELAPCLP